ncbi:MAG: aminotransferase class IV [Firmicutes bacterium]|nr:aminotransferase class IV [Bacillota bacterium]
MLELTLETRVDLASSSLRHGAGLFETIRWQEGRARWLELHLERMAQGCAFLGLEAPPQAQEIHDFLDRHQIGKGLSFGALRLVAVDDRLHLWVEAMPPPSAAPVSLGRSRAVTRFSADPWLRFKTLSYLPNHTMAQEAASNGHFDVIALNERGFLTDGGRTSLFVGLERRIYTPPVEDGALPGIGRRLILEAGLAEERSLRWEDLGQAESLFLINALRGGLPVFQLEKSRHFSLTRDMMEAILALWHGATDSRSS